MPVFCRNCKKENHDPSGELSWNSCRFCGGQLFRSKGIGRLAGAGAGAAIGAGLGGPIGAVVGGFLGFFVGNGVDKKM
jgi:hypothetical protein